MTTEVWSATEVPLDVDLATASSRHTALAAAPMVESVAGVVSGISVIGQARNALQAAGWTATIAANRITVDHAVEAQLIPATVGTYGAIDARWIVSSIAGTNPVWIVGAG